MRLFKLKIIFPSLFLLLNACAGASDSIDKVTIDGVNLSLNNKSCVLMIGNEKLSIKEMKPNCFFVKNSASGKTDSKYYDDIGANVLLVVGTISPKDKEYPLTLKRNDCGTQIQALILKKGKPTLSKVSSNTLICAGVGTDEKMFYILSHPS